MVLTVPDRDDWFDESHGFPRPNWDAIHEWMEIYAQDANLEDAWQQVVRQWMARLQRTMGGTYTPAETENFVLFSDLDAKTQRRLLEFMERSRAQMLRVLGDISPEDAFGKHVLLRFSNPDAYYRYVSHFHADGDYAGSVGMFLADGYHHIVYTQNWSPDEERRTMVHELSHNLVGHLSLPPWLNEALAMAFEGDLAGDVRGPLTRELADRHREYWDERTIQEFWRGASFADVDGQELAYSLAQVLLRLIHTEIQPSPEEFRAFVVQADWGDAGAAAAREHLDVELADLVAAFLGEGEWEPVP